MRYSIYCYVDKDSRYPVYIYKVDSLEKVYDCMKRTFSDSNLSTVSKLEVIEEAEENKNDFNSEE